MGEPVEAVVLAQPLVGSKPLVALAVHCHAGDPVADQAIVRCEGVPGEAVPHAGARSGAQPDRTSGLRRYRGHLVAGQALGRGVGGPDRPVELAGAALQRAKPDIPGGVLGDGGDTLAG